MVVSESMCKSKDRQAVLCAGQEPAGLYLVLEGVLCAFLRAEIDGRKAHEGPWKQASGVSRGFGERLF